MKMHLSTIPLHLLVGLLSIVWTGERAAGQSRGVIIRTVSYSECGSTAGECALSPSSPEPPVIAIQIIAPEKQCDNEISYRIIVHNRGHAAAHHVVIHNPVPANARYVRAEPAPDVQQPELQWRFGTMQGGEKREITLILTPTDAGDIENCARVTFEHGVCVKTRICQKPAAPPPPKTKPALRLSKRGPVKASVGDKIPYQLIVTNAGNGPATNVQLTDLLPDGLELEDQPARRELAWEVGTLGPGEAKSADYQVMVRKGGRLCNRAVVTGDDGLRDEVEHCVDVFDAKISLQKTGPSRAYAGMAFQYRLTVNNDGSAPVNNVVVTDTLPAEFSLLGASDNAERNINTNQVRWLAGTLGPGASRTVSLTVRGDTRGEFRNQAQAVADGGLKADAELRTEILGLPALQLEVVDKPDPVEMGEKTTYTIIVKNQGSLPVTKVVIVAHVPQEMAVTDVKSPGGGVKHKIDGRKVVYEPFTLEPMKDAIFNVEVQAVTPGSVRFRAELSADQLPSGSVTEEEPTIIYDPNPDDE